MAQWPRAGVCFNTPPKNKDDIASILSGDEGGVLWQLQGSDSRKRVKRCNPTTLPKGSDPSPILSRLGSLLFIKKDQKLTGGYFPK